VSQHVNGVRTERRREMTTLFGIAIGVAPFLVIVGLFRLIDRIGRRREEGLARQVELTDAIHRELGAAAAPIVRRRLGGEWLVTMRAPLDRPGTVAALVRITDRVFARRSGAQRHRLVIVLMARGSSATATAGMARPAGHQPVAPPVAA